MHSADDWNQLKNGLASASNAYTTDIEQPIMRGTRELSSWAEGLINSNCLIGPLSSALGTWFKDYTGVAANPCKLIALVDGVLVLSQDEARLRL